MYTRTEIQKLRSSLTTRCLSLTDDPWEALWLAVEATRWYQDQERKLSPDRPKERERHSFADLFA